MGNIAEPWRQRTRKSATVAAPSVSGRTAQLVEMRGDSREGFGVGS